MHRGIKSAVALVAITGVLFAGTSAMAGSDRKSTVTTVQATGTCSGSSTWRLTLKQSDTSKVTGVMFQVHEGVKGDLWGIQMAQNDHRFFRGHRVTRGDLGAFTVRRLVRNPDGTDLYRAAAIDQATGETCEGSASI